KTWLPETVYLDVNEKGEIRVAGRKAPLKESDVVAYLKGVLPKVAPTFRKVEKKPLAVVRVRDSESLGDIKKWSALVNKAGFRAGVEVGWPALDFSRSLKRGPGEARLIVDAAGTIRTYDGKRLADLEAVVAYLQAQAPRLRKEARAAGNKTELIGISIYGMG